MEVNLFLSKMRKKSESTERKTKSSRRKSKPGDPGNASAGFDDKNTGEISNHNQTVQTDVLLGEDDISMTGIDQKEIEEDKGSDVPENVSWKASKERIIQERTREKEAHQDYKRKEKQMRIERNERLLEQKKRKREREYSRLPMEVLQKVARQQESQTLEFETSTSSGGHVTFDSSSEKEEEYDECEKDDEISAMKVVVISKEIRKPKKVQQSATSFLQERLFGGRVQRISPLSEIDRDRRRYVYAPASKFSKNCV